MDDAPKAARGAALLWLLAAVAGCGGGGGGGSGSPPAPPPPAADTATLSVQKLPDAAVAAHLVEFAATGSTASGAAATLSWDFGDGSPIVTSASANHVFVQPGIYTVTVTLSSTSGATASESEQVTVHANAVPTTPQIQASVASADVGQSVNFSTASTDPDGDPVSYRWDLGDGTPISSGSPQLMHSFASAGTYRVRVVAEDGYGGVSSGAIDLMVNDPTPPPPPPPPPPTSKAWTQVVLPDGLSLMDTQWVDAQTGFILASDVDTVPGLRTSVFATTDGGAHWTRHEVDDAYSRRLVFTDANTGFIVGNGRWEFVPAPGGQGGGTISTTRQIMKSTDGGVTWRSVLSSGLVSQGLYDLQFVSATVGWAVGAGGRILKSTDAGETWQPVTSGSVDRLLRVQFVDALHGWILSEPMENASNVAGDRDLLRTVDGGVTWTPVRLPLALNGMRSMHFTSANVGWVLGMDLSNGVAWVLRTTDAGQQQWDLLQAPNGVSTFAREVIAADANTAWLGDHEGDLWRTDDAGLNWTQLVDGLAFPALQTERFLRVGAKTFKVVGRNGVIGSVTLD